jgi:putative PEP-CTERM system TPR-repeat lipoprotein
MKSMSLIRRLAVILTLTVGLLFLATGCSKVTSFRASRALSTADKQYAAGNYGSAEINYQKVLRFKQLHPGAIRQLGLIYFKSGRLPRAYSFLQKAVELDPENVEARTSMGLIALTFRDFKNAAQQANFVLSKQPTNEDAVLLLAESVSSSNAAIQVVQQLRTLIQVNGDQAAYRLALGTLALKSGSLTNATKEVFRAYELDPKSPAVLSALGLLALQSKQVDQAGEYFKAAADLSPLRSPRRLKYAMFKLQFGGADQAATILRDITEKAPDYIPAYLSLAQIAFTSKDFAEADKVVKTILLRDDSNYEALLLAGNLKLAQNDAKGAVADFTRAQSIYKQSAQVLIGLARALVFNGDSAKAISSLNLALTIDTNSVEATVMLAELNLQKGDFTAALASLSRVVKRQPQIPQAHLLLATAHLSRQNYQDALNVYRNMAQLFPKSPEVYFLTAGVFMRAKDFTAARKAAAQALELAPDYLPASEMLVDLDLAENKFADAHARAAKLVEAKPNAADPRLIEAKVFLAEKDFSKAEAALLKTIEINPESSKAYFWLAGIYYDSGKHAEALAKLNALVTKTNDVSAYMQIGLIHESQSKFEAARDAYEKVLELNPRFSPALNNLAYIYAERLSQPDKALPLAESARQLMPYSPAATDTLGWVLYRKGDYVRALGLLQEAASKAPDEPEIQFHAGMVSYMMGEEAAARAALSLALQSTHDAPYKVDARARLATLELDPRTASADSLQAILKKQANDTFVLLRLAGVYERDREYPKAVDTYETLVKTLPQNGRFKIKLAQLYSGPLHNEKKALELAKEAHSLLPGDTEVMRTLGRLALDSGDTTWAASLLQDAARKAPEDLELQYSLAWALYLTGDQSGALDAMQTASSAPSAAPFLPDAKQFIAFTAAASDLARAKSLAGQVSDVLKTNSSYVPALVISAKLDLASGKADQAAKSYGSLLDKYPNFALAARELTILSATNPNPDPKTFDLGLKARTAYPTDPDLARALGVLSYQRSDFVRAIQYLKESILKNPKDAEALFYLGTAQFRQKSPKDAKATLQQALDLGTLPPSLADEAKKTLAGIK